MHDEMSARHAEIHEEAWASVGGKVRIIWVLSVKEWYKYPSEDMTLLRQWEWRQNRSRVCGWVELSVFYISPYWFLLFVSLLFFFLCYAAVHRLGTPPANKRHTWSSSPVCIYILALLQFVLSDFAVSRLLSLCFFARPSHLLLLEPCSSCITSPLSSLPPSCLLFACLSTSSVLILTLCIPCASLHAAMDFLLAQWLNAALLSLRSP